MIKAIAAGAAGFCALALYDLSQLGRTPVIAVRLLGFAGYGCVAVSVLLAFGSAPLQPLSFPVRTALFAASGFMFLLLAYSVLIEIPLRCPRDPGRSRNGGTYGRRTYRSGTYRLCRHPGVLWFALMLAPQAPFRAAGFGITAAALVAMDLMLVAFEDIVVFPRLFPDYREYREEVPFLVPRFRRRGRGESAGRELEREGDEKNGAP